MTMGFSVGIAKSRLWGLLLVLLNHDYRVSDPVGLVHGHTGIKSEQTPLLTCQREDVCRCHVQFWKLGIESQAFHLRPVSDQLGTDGAETFATVRLQSLTRNVPREVG